MVGDQPIATSTRRLGIYRPGADRALLVAGTRPRPSRSVTAGPGRSGSAGLAPTTIRLTTGVPALSPRPPPPGVGRTPHTPDPSCRPSRTDARWLGSTAHTPHQGSRSATPPHRPTPLDPPPTRRAGPARPDVEPAAPAAPPTHPPDPRPTTRRSAHPAPPNPARSTATPSQSRQDPSSWAPDPGPSPAPEAAHPPS